MRPRERDAISAATGEIMLDNDWPWLWGLSTPVVIAEVASSDTSGDILITMMESIAIDSQLMRRPRPRIRSPTW